ncbi:atrial natriuretic peptide receptor 1-like [Panonychus citri]|uniref:atrial natriuretic peptide receptor 1-like n=1 Tax=Panonychus citri TaxID=50023 RepID=UPI0023072A17|nr:atrial natriuretic peptide receptor 1-like [Panonychus citri]
MIIIALIALAIHLISKKIKFETDLGDLWWQIKWDDLVFPEKQIGKRSTLSLGISESSFHKSAASIASPISLNSSLGTTLKNISGVLVAMHKGTRVAVKNVAMKKFHMNRKLLMELKLMRETLHENINRFVGLCIEEPNHSIIAELCIRGSLRDLLENESMQLDWVFKYAMITDIAEGMIYLHGSPIQFHGNLNSSNCLINERFTVKITDYGIREFRKQIDRMEDFNPRKFFWKAPEHLRDRDPFNSGSRKGDVYSYGIILQEIITRSGPFESMERLGRKRAHMEPDEILDRIRMGMVPPFRPEVSSDEAPKELITLMHQAWHENPDCRPEFTTIKPWLRRITKGISSKNLVDNLLNRMEQYTNNLERMVEEKTESLLEEKKKTEEILYQLLPKFVAEELKKGGQVHPEAFDSVSIFFSDIVGFTSISAESSPLQVVDLLNYLYTTFDCVIEKYDCYKVETIGDAYMVASGLPVRNGDEHVREICRMSLELRNNMRNCVVPHSPSITLAVRIGVHSGPVAAGVVGLKMPKYCLFGDTVNTASRMESNGEPHKIHISKQTRDIIEQHYREFIIVPRGEIEIKGKGIMKTYWLEGEAIDPNPKITKR